MKAKPFSNIPVVDRPGKPRESGITMMIDWGIGVAAQDDVLNLCGEYVDLAKIAVGIAGLLESDVLAAKMESYDRHGVMPFPGGMYLEYAVDRDLEDAYFKDAKAAGFRCIEVSDNTVPFTPDQKRDLIKKAIEEYDLVVLGEVGSKIQVTETQAFVKDVVNCLKAGSWKVFLEAADLFDERKKLRTELLHAIRNELPINQLIFELPGWWLGALGAENVGLIKMLIGEFGPDVNIANVGPNEVMYLETDRRRTGVAGFSG